MKRITTIFMTSVALATTATAAVHTYKDTPFDFMQTITSDAGVANDASNAYRNLANWEVNTTVTEEDGVDDELSIGWNARHVNAPHGELPQDKFVVGNLTVDGEKEDPVVGGTKDWSAGPVRHGDHFDKFQAQVVYTVESGFWDWDQITKYSFVLIGFHTDDPCEYRNFKSTQTGDNMVPRTPSEAHGNTLFAYNTLTNTYSINMAVVGTDSSRLIGLRMYIGMPGQQGTPIADIAVGEDFQIRGPKESVLMLDHRPFPIQYLHFLNKGMIYLVLHTERYPNGELRGQLKEGRNLSFIHP
jgi:hypothetical protein